MYKEFDRKEIEKEDKKCPKLTLFLTIFSLFLVLLPIFIIFISIVRPIFKPLIDFVFPLMPTWKERVVAIVVIVGTGIIANKVTKINDQLYIIEYFEKHSKN